ncbi:MAG: cache domain-containing protein [Paucibacter sp.]|nr:cache domain-containing protein [Roseateles sp.]
MFDSLPLRRKIYLIVGTALAGVLALSIYATWIARTYIAEDLRDDLVTAVRTAASTVQAYQARAAKGEMSVEDAQKAAALALKGARFGSEGKDYFYIWTLDGHGVMHPFKPEWTGLPMLGKIMDGDGQDTVAALIKGVQSNPERRGFVQTKFPRPGGTEAIPKLQYVIGIDGWDWVIGAGLYTDDTDAAVRRATETAVGVGVLVFAAVLALSSAVGSSLRRQMGGDPAEAAAGLDAVAAGNLAVDINAPVPHSLLDTLSRMVRSLRGTIGEVRQVTENINTASSEIATGNMDLSQRTEEMASSLQRTAAALEQITGHVRQTADAAATAAQLAGSAAEVAQRGGRVVEGVVTTMGEINASSQRIADIIGTIDGIAFQTNILALNAAVEAARAGEQGRGFAVVAGEVRALAQRSAEAAKEIKVLIGDSVEKVGAGSRLVGDAGSTMQEILANVQRLTDIVGEISAAAREQSGGVEDVNTSMAQLDQVTQQNAALVEQSAAAAESLKEQARRLSEVVGGFRLQG